jgi:hypothetical protein
MKEDERQEGARFSDFVFPLFFVFTMIKHESLILAQNERWRHA